MGISEQDGMVLSVLQLSRPLRTLPNTHSFSMDLQCTPWRYGSKLDMHDRVSASTDLAWGLGMAGGLAEELTLKLIPDCVISRSQDQNDVRVTGEAT